MLLQRGNSKLGPLIHTFSLPAFETCPGYTAACLSVCYAQRGFYAMPAVSETLRQAHAASKKRNFVKSVVQQIRKEKVRIVRLHPAGDFYSKAYIYKWQAIARRCGSTTFYGYTRAWRCNSLLPALIALSRQHNVVLWWSTDCETDRLDGKPPQVKGVRTTYMQLHADDCVPAYADLVFRVKRDTICKYANGRLVCPVENGYTNWVYKMTCSDCKICYRAKAVPKRPRSYTGPPKTAIIQLSQCR